MSSSESAPSLLEQLRAKYGVVEDRALYGPSVVIPNSELKREWSLLLERAGYSMYVGEQDGRVAWIVPLKPRKPSASPADKPLGNGLPPDSQLPIKNPGCSQDPRSDEANPSTSMLQASQDQAPSRGCITGRLWTSQEDQQLLGMLGQGKAVTQIAGELASKLGRTEGAVKSRLLKLKRRQKVEFEPAQAGEKPLESQPGPGGPLGFKPGGSELLSLLSSALLLAEDPKHKPALRLVLEACIRLATLNKEK